MDCKKTVLWVCFSLLFLSFSHAQKQPVVYHHYVTSEKDMLRSLHEGGGISSFPSMRALQQQAAGVEESTVTKARLQKPGKKAMSGEQMVAERSESVLLMCRYTPPTQHPEAVEIGATGYVLGEDGVCATNYHVLQPIISQKHKLTPADSLYFVGTQSGKIYPIVEILSYNKAADIALFRIDTGGEKLKPIPVGSDLAAGASIHALTHPLWHPFYYSKGVVARTIRTDAGDPFSNRTDITADYAKGSSGGPLFDDCGNLVAMVSTTQSIYYVEQPQTSLQMVVKSAIPVSSILRLIEGRSANAR